MSPVRLHICTCPVLTSSHIPTQCSLLNRHADTRAFLVIYINQAAGQCLHSTTSGTNPYMMVLSVMCRTLSAFDDDQMISAYGFGGLLALARVISNAFTTFSEHEGCRSPRRSCLQMCQAKTRPCSVSPQTINKYMPFQVCCRPTPTWHLMYSSGVFYSGGCLDEALLT